MHYSACMVFSADLQRARVVFLLFGAIICVVLFADFGKTTSLVADSLFDFGHVPLFAVVAALVLWVLDRKRWIRTDSKTYAKAFVAGMVLAVASEIIQFFIPWRSCQAGDFLRDTAGISAFLLTAYRYRRPLSATIGRLMTLIACLVVVAALVPVALAVRDEVRATREFPLLASFETPYEMRRWAIKEGVSERTHRHATHGTYALMLRLEPGVYPGATLDFPPRDWRGYQALVFDAYLEGASPMPLTVCINDLEHNEEYTDRYNKTFTLVPGPNRVTIDLGEVERAPVGRKMDMGRIALVCLFSYNLKEPRTVYLDNVRLETFTAPNTPP